MTTNLGKLGNIRDMSDTYAPGSFETSVEFVVDGLTFIAHKFVRTDLKIDNVYLYIKHESSWMTDLVKTVDQANPCKVGARAMHLIAVSMCVIPTDGAERFAQIELV